MNSEIFEKHESEVRSYCRSFPTVFTHSKGSELFDEDGKRYIDFFCGAGALNYGHNNDYIKNKVLEYIANDGVIHSLDMHTKAKREFIETLETTILEPRGLDYKIMFPAPTGTNAIEAALKVARKVKKRSNVFALMGGFHGMTLGSLALTTDECSRGGAGLPLIGVTHIPAPYMFPNLDTIKYMETLITDDHSGVELPAAIVIETVQSEGGIYVFSDEWLRRVRALCDKYDILLIVDDIQVGCGRTGSFFSFERAGIVPDIVAMSKSIGGYGLPFAILLFKPELDMWKPGEHNGTFRGNNPAFVAAKAAIEVFNNDNIADETIRKGSLAASYIEQEILPLNAKLVMRGIGLAIGLDFSQLGGGNTAKAVMNAAFDKGVIIERVGRDNAVLKIMPPLTISDELLVEGLQKLRDAIRETL